MNPLAVTIAAAFLAVGSQGRAASAAQPAAHDHGKSPTHAGGASPQAAIDHAAAAQQQAYQQALRHQMTVQQHMVQQYQQAIHEQIKAKVLAHPASGQGHPATSVRSNSPRPPQPGVVASGSSSYLNSPHHYAHSPGHSYHHHRSYHQPYRHRRTWPGTEDPEYAALLHLRQALDRVPARGAGSPGGHRSAIEQALMQVVEVNQTPGVGAIDRLAGDVEVALARRTRPVIETGTIALALRGGVNDSALIAAERTEVVRELQAALKQGGVPAPEVAAVVASLHNVGHQGLSQHARR